MNEKAVNIDYEKACAEMCKRSLSFFVREFWNEIIPDTLIWNWHMDALCNEVQTVTQRAINKLPKENDLIINVPPGTSKTTIVSVMATAWEFAVMPNIRTAVGSYSDDAIKDIADKIRILIKSEKFKRYFPEVQIRKGHDTKHNFKTTVNGSFYAFTIGGTLTSKHYDILKVDDPLNPKIASSEAGLLVTNTFFSATLSTRKTNKEVTPTILIMQRLHENDPTGYLMSRKKQKLRHICLPAELSNLTTEEYKKFYKNGLLDEIRLSRNVLDELKVDLGSQGYANQIEQSPTPLEGGIVKKHWFKRITHKEFHELYGKKVFDFFADTAYSSDPENDPTGIIATCLINNNLYITKAKKVRFEFPELIIFLKQFVNQHGYTFESSLNIEPKASGKSSVQMIKRSTEINVIETETPKEDKKARLESVVPFIESGKVWILEDGEWNEEFIEEVSGFPNKKHDEYVDVLYYAITKKITKKGVSFEQLKNMF